MEQGKQLTHYTLIDKVGQGGMGEVWRATDTRLDREVAIKILPPAFVDDEERLTRFEREAKALAALNHPHIAQIFGIDQVDDICFLVLELVPGETLADRVSGGALPVEEALELCRQLAEGLEAAHDAHVVHRDLKPANVRVTPEGVVKVLDFGLAKAGRADPETGETLPLESGSLELTVEGRVLGTPTYMSPEQARGKRTDRRTDIWAFGCVLFELLSGSRPFTGETVTDVLGAIVHKEPEWESLPPRTPTRVRELLRRCLTKDPRGRLRDIGDARLELEEILADPSATMAIEPVGSARKSSPLRAFALLLCGLALGAVAVWFARDAMREPPPVRRFRFAPEGLDIGGLGGGRISPDGKKIAFAADGQLWLRELDQLEARPLPGTQLGTNLCWSPDSRHLGFVADKVFWRLPIDGGPRLSMAHLNSRPSGGFSTSWRSDDTILWVGEADGAPVMQVSANGGDPRPFWEFDPEEIDDLHGFSSLPDAAGLLLGIHPRIRTGENAQVGAGIIGLLLPGSDEPKVLLELEPGNNIHSPIYSPTGHVLYSRWTPTTGVWAFPFSLSSLERTGEPFLVAPDALAASASSDGSLLYASTRPDASSKLSWLSRDGLVLDDVTEPIPGQSFEMSLGPQGRRAVLSSRLTGNQMDLFVHDLELGTRHRLISQDEGFVMGRGWSTSGDQILYVRNWMDPEMGLVATDGSGEVNVLGRGMFPWEITPDGQSIVVEITDDPEKDLYLTPITGGGTTEPWLGGEGEQDNPSFSPDGNFLAYTSKIDGRHELVLTRYPSLRGRWLLDEREVESLRWSPLGDELLFADRNDNLLSIPLELSEDSVQIGKPEVLFNARDQRAKLSRGFGVSEDGQRILVVRDPQSGATGDEMVIVENWVESFAQR